MCLEKLCRRRTFLIALGVKWSLYFSELALVEQIQLAPPEGKNSLSIVSPVHPRIMSRVSSKSEKPLSTFLWILARQHSCVLSALVWFYHSSLWEGQDVDILGTYVSEFKSFSFKSHDNVTIHSAKRYLRRPITALDPSIAPCLSERSNLMERLMHMNWSSFSRPLGIHSK